MIFIYSIAAIAAISFLQSNTLFANAHGGHEQIPIAADADWATRHMAGENSLTLDLSIY